MQKEGGYVRLCSKTSYKHKVERCTEIFVTLERAIFRKACAHDEFVVKVASSLEEYVHLLEVGFDYIGDYDGKKVLRKRK